MEPTKKQQTNTQGDLAEAAQANLAEEPQAAGTKPADPTGLDGGIKSLKLNEQRSSGAARRKAAILKAKAEGKPILPRRRKRAKEDRASETLAPSCSSQAKLTQKRGRSEEGTPSPHQIPKRSKVGGQAKAQLASKTGYADAVSTTKMCIALEGFPDNKITQEQSEKVQLSLLQNLTSQKLVEEPQYQGCYLDRGALVVQCIGAHSVDWLTNNVKNIKPWDGANLIVGLARDLMDTSKVLLYAPKLYNSVQPGCILKSLGAQNKGLNTSDWRLINSVRGANGHTLTLSMGTADLREIQSRGLKLYLGLGQINLRPTKKSDGGQPEDSSDKPPAQ